MPSRALIKAKRAGKEPPAPPEHKPSNVINLMDALRRSVGEKGGKSRGDARRKSSGGRTSAKKKDREAQAPEEGELMRQG
jgi:DNA end-binding protein Ku